ncbi:MAG: type II/IV secretion system ATPase subunit [Methanohalobium sp.]|uniref:type II/IV secretion system ATPase subunit n=1 Tax=Methanohalobium sp. TaxID=2837493 RepID=UPI00397CB3EA
MGDKNGPESQFDKTDKYKTYTSNSPDFTDAADNQPPDKSGPKMFTPGNPNESESSEPEETDDKNNLGENFDKDDYILTPSDNLETPSRWLSQKHESEKKQEHDFGFLTPESNFESNKVGVEETQEQTEGQTKTEYKSEKPEIQNSEKGSKVNSGKNLVKKIIQENKSKKTIHNTGNSSSGYDESFEGNDDTEDLKFLDKVKNLFKQETFKIEAYNPDVHGPLSVFKGVEGYKEIDRYWVNEPYAFVVILFNPEINDYLYYLIEPELTDFEQTFLTEIKDRLRNALLVEDIENNGDKEAVLDEKIRTIIKDYAIEITPLMLEKISYYIKRDFVRYGKIDPLMNDDYIEDISGNGHEIPLFLYHRLYHNIATNITFKEDELDSFIIRLAQKCGKHISLAEPMVDASMPDGSRVQMTLSTTITTHGSTFTIRKFSEVPITPIDLIDWGTFSSEQMAYLWLCIENNKSLIYAGGTASGKTSSLNAVSLFVPEKAKIVTLEDTREIKLPHTNWIPGVTRDSFTADERGAVDMYDLLRAALRQRPEYLLVGEVRGKEALTLFQAMSTGHTTFSTMHADSVPSAIHRLENPPISVPRNMIQALDIISIQAQTYVRGKRARKNLKIVEIVDIDPNTRNLRTNDIFVWDSSRDTFQRTGESQCIYEIQQRRGWNAAQIREELRYRQQILDYMVDNDIRNFKEISEIIKSYQATPEKLLQKIGLK